MVLNESLLSDIEIEEVTDNNDNEDCYQLIDSFTLDIEDIDIDEIIRYIVTLHNKLYFFGSDCKEPCIYIERKYDYAHKDYNKITMYDNYDEFSNRTIKKEMNELTPDNIAPMCIKFVLKFMIVHDKNYSYESFIEDMYKIYRTHFINSTYNDMYFHTFTFLSHEGDSIMLWPSNNGKMIFSETPLRNMFNILNKSSEENRYTHTQFHNRYTSKTDNDNIKNIAVRLSRKRFNEFELNYILTDTKRIDSDNFTVIQKSIYMDCGMKIEQSYKSGRIIDFVFQAFANNIKKNDIKNEKHKTNDYLVLNIYVKTEPDLVESKSEFSDNNDSFFGEFNIDNNGERYTINIILIDDHYNNISNNTISKFGIKFDSRESLFK